MFTGLVETTGTLVARRLRGGHGMLWLGAPAGFTADVALGDSVCVDGVCVTAVDVVSDGFRIDVTSETLDKTTLGRVQLGHRFNLEKSLRPSDRLGGHFVTGHVDGVAKLLSIELATQSWAFSLPDSIRRLVAGKGSVTINGVSLTVNAVEQRAFSVALIPHTLEKTNLGSLSVGDPVNLEADLLARYWLRWQETGGSLDDPTSIQVTV